MQANLLFTKKPEALTGYWIAQIDGAKSKTLKGFYKEIAAVLDFPDYFGFNLDSLDEFLNDLSWITEENIVLFIADSQYFIDNNSDQDKLNSLLALLDEAAYNWKMTENNDQLIPQKKLKIAFSPNKRLKQLLDRLGIKYEIL